MSKTKPGGKNAANMAIRTAVMQLAAASISVGKLCLFSDFDLPEAAVLRLQEINNLIGQQAASLESVADDFLADLAPQKHNGVV